MTKQKRVAACEAMLYAGIKNLFQSQSILGMEQFTISVLEILMFLEREEYLKGNQGKEDIGNGTYKRSFRALHPNSLLISIPRTRNGQFKPLTLELLTQQQEQINQFALLLYRKGMSSRDVSSIMKDFFGEKMSYDTVNNLAESFHEIRKKWENSPLDAYYKVIYCDALYVNVKCNNSYTKEALHVIYGVKEDNTRELLLLEVNPTESHKVWGDYYKKLRKRGVNSVDLIVADGLKGLSDTARCCFPRVNFQRCVIHKMRNVLNKVRPRDKTAVAQELKDVFSNFESISSLETAEAKLAAFCTRWQSLSSCGTIIVSREYK